MYISIEAREEMDRQVAAFIEADNDRVANDSEYAKERADYVNYLLGR